MQRTEFLRYRRRLEPLFLAALDARSAGVLDEQAVPSYTHRYFFIRDFFWQRIWIVMNYLERIRPRRVLDFGCGSGVLIPFLRSIGAEVVAFDVEPDLVTEIMGKLGQQDIEIVADPTRLQAFPDDAFDTVTALDVLEHVDDLTGTAALLHRLVHPAGYLVVSGPTETELYRLGRKIAGFHQHFHVRTIQGIEDELRRGFRLRSDRALWPLMPLFRISVWSPMGEAFPRPVD